MEVRALSSGCRVRCPGDRLRQNRMIFYRDINRRMFLKDITPERNPCPSQRNTLPITVNILWPHTHSDSFLRPAPQRRCISILFLCRSCRWSDRQTVSGRTHACRQSSCADRRIIRKCFPANSLWHGSLISENFDIHRPWGGCPPLRALHYLSPCRYRCPLFQRPTQLTPSWKILLPGVIPPDGEMCCP